MFEKANLIQSDHSQPPQVLNVLDTEVFYPLVIPLKVLYTIKAQPCMIAFLI